MLDQHDREFAVLVQLADQADDVVGFLPSRPSLAQGIMVVVALAAERGDDRWERVAEPIERIVTETKKLPPNVDWPCARLYHYLGLQLDVYTPIFAMARIAGWAAHIIEQLDHNRLMRPRARYVGPAPLAAARAASMAT